MVRLREELRRIENNAIQRCLTLENRIGGVRAMQIRADETVRTQREALTLLRQRRDLDAAAIFRLTREVQELRADADRAWRAAGLGVCLGAVSLLAVLLHG